MKSEPLKVGDSPAAVVRVSVQARAGGTSVLVVPMFSNLLAEEQVLFLGEDFFPWMVLALGAAMVVGNLIALVRPPDPERRSAGGSGGAAESDPQPDRPRPPLGRAAVMIGVGLVAAGWGIASLLS